MPTRNVYPRSPYESRELITRAQPQNSGDKTPFAKGAFPDLPGSSLDLKSVHWVKNYLVYPDGLRTRTGSRKWTSATLPYLPGRTGYALTKSGYRVTKTVGTNFSAADVGNYIVFDDGTHERISAYVSTTQVDVETNTAHSASTTAWIRGPINARIFHRSLKKVFIHIDTRIFYATPAISSWTQIFQCGLYAPSSTKSLMKELDDFIVLFNAAGKFTIDVDAGVYWRSNSPIPTTRITDQAKTTTKPYARKYVYSLSRTKDRVLNQDRTTTGVEIVEESGTVKPDGSSQDCGTVYTSRPIGEGSTTYAVLTGATLTTPYDVSSGWSGINNGQFNITVNGVTKNIVCDFTGVQSMAEVAARIQIGIRDFFSNIECDYQTDHFVITNPIESGSLGYVSAGSGGTDIGSTGMKCQSGTGTIANNKFTEPVTVGMLEIPVDSTTGYYNQHWDVYSVYASLDVGENGVDPVSGEGNNTELLIWLYDLPVAKSFVAGMSGDTITATEGTFHSTDVGTAFRFQSGNEYTINEFVSDSSVKATTTGTEASQAAAIGGSNANSKPIRVMTASQTNNRVTRTAGDSFSSGDVGKPIWWPTGIKSTIKTYVDANNVDVVETRTVSSTGCCIEPKMRAFSDSVRDDISTTHPNLRSRVTLYTLQHRFFTPLPDCDMGEITASVLWCCIRGTQIVYYTGIPVNRRYGSGYYYAKEQKEIFKDQVNEMSEVGDVLSIKCARSTRGIATNIFDSYSLPQAGISIIKSSGHFPVAEEIGVKHYGGVRTIDSSRQIVITSEPGIREFNGRSYGPNLATNRIEKILKKLQTTYATSYDPINGFIFWGIN